MDITALLGFANTLLTKENIKTKEPMSEHISFRVGGPAEVFLTVPGEEELGRLVAYLNGHKIPYFVLGKGTNLLVSDKGFEGVIISLGEHFTRIQTDGRRIKAGAGASMEAVSQKAMEAGLTGLEFAAGIPGSLGGGVVMNAGAYGGEMSQVITRVRAMNGQGEIVCFKKDESKFGYRSSIYRENRYIVIEASLELQTGCREDILFKMEEYNRQRREKQPLEYPSAGSTFKRPKGYFAGKLIMDAGLRGFSVGGAQISEKHCGFVINRNQATAADVRNLMKEVQKRVKEQFDVQLEPEVIFLGEDC